MASVQIVSPEIGGPCFFVKPRQDVAKNDQYCTGDTKYGDHKAGISVLQLATDLEVDIFCSKDCDWYAIPGMMHLIRMPMMILSHFRF